jgi:hypothetical protein
MLYNQGIVKELSVFQIQLDWLKRKQAKKNQKFFLASQEMSDSGKTFCIGIRR